MEINKKNLRLLLDGEIIEKGDLWTEIGMGYIEASEKYIGTKNSTAHNDEVFGAWFTFRPLRK